MKKENKIEPLYITITITKCNLYFAKKAILIEGPTERIIMPAFIRKYDAQAKSKILSSQYISTIEIGGAYAHHFYKFLDILELKTLIITDLDSINKADSNKSCMVSKGTHTSNAGIRNWFNESDDIIDLNKIISKAKQEKINGFRCIAYQIPENGGKIIGRSFEDAFIIANPKLFGGVSMPLKHFFNKLHIKKQRITRIKKLILLFSMPLPMKSGSFLNI